MKKVAIIEDQTAIRDMIAFLIQNLPGYKIVVESGDGKAALDLCLEFEPDLVILDVMLPGLNGTEVLRRLSKQLPKSRVLIFSGYQDPSLLRELVEAGAHGFIGKTAPLTDLRKGFEVVSDGGTYFSPEIAGVLREAMNSNNQSGIPAHQKLTTRERETLQLIAESNSTRDIAKKLDISVKTAENHRTNLMKKLDLHDVASLTRFAIEFRIIEPPARPSVQIN